MDYTEIDKVLAIKNLATDPAFDDLLISIEDIPCFDTCPLGLYFPVQEWNPNVQGMVPKQTIIIPPDATEAVLLHELGHRHGHYYYDNLSEKYAEGFRKKYQKGRTLLYIGDDFSRLPKFGALFEEGEKGAVELAFNSPLTPDELYDIESQLYQYDTTPKVSYGNSEIAWLRVEFTTGVNWPVIIAGIGAGVTVLTAFSLGYALYKAAEEMPWIVPVSLFGFGAILVFKFAGDLSKKFAVRG